MSEVSRVSASPQALAIAAQLKPEKKSKYPFDELGLNESFTIELAKANASSLQVMASRKSKDGKRFVVVKHEELDPPLIEVARVA